MKVTREAPLLPAPGRSIELYSMKRSCRLAALLACGLFGCTAQEPLIERSAPGTPDGERDRADGSRAEHERLVAVYVALSSPPAAAMVPRGSDPARHTLEIRRAVAAARAQQASVKTDLEAKHALVLAELVRLTNAIEVLVSESELDRIRAIPGVVRIDRVTRVERVAGSAVPVTGAPELWSRATPLLGDGVRVGMIDSGIDYTHADFGGPGTPAAYQANDRAVIEPGSFPTARVIGGYDFVGDDYDAGNPNTQTPVPDPDPLDCAQGETNPSAGGHGTHVAGIAGGQGVRSDGTPYTGPYTLSLDPAAFLVSPGMAPHADLFALKIFGCRGSTDALSPALEWAADPNDDGDFSDRLDVVNLSLGSAYGLGAVTEAEIVKNLTALGTLVVVAAGNEGGTFFSVSAPATLPEVVAVAASAELSLVTLRVDAPASVAGELPASEAQFTTPLSVTGSVSGSLVAAEPNLACSALTNANEISGKIALIDRGDCLFTDKFQNAIAAGATAVVVIDSVQETLPFIMSGDPISPSIPGVLIGKNDGDALRNALPSGVSVTLDPTPYNGPGSELLADFSSRGPSAVDSLVKPDLAAPGFLIESAAVGSGSLARTEMGTSMACPFVTGAAALLRQAHPELAPFAIKAALMNTAAPLADALARAYPISLAGSGRIDVARAANATVTARDTEADGRTSVSFDPLIAAEPAELTRTIELANHGASAATFSVTANPFQAPPGVTISVSPSTVSVPQSGTATVDLKLTLDPSVLGAPAPDALTPSTQFDQPRQFLTEASGLVAFEDGAGASRLVLPFYGVVRAASHLHFDAASACRPDFSASPAKIPLIGDSAHPRPVTSAFELGATSPTRVDSATNPAGARLDLVAVGAASDLAVTAFDTATISFGVAVAGTWTTPALGQASLVTIRVDSNLDGLANFEIRVEPYSETGPYADVLAATVYQLPDETAVGSKRYVNLVPASDLDTQPFYNGVLVIPAYAKDIGLSDSATEFQYSAATHSIDLVNDGEVTDFVRFDAARPALDTARGGNQGRPLYSGTDPVTVWVDPSRVGGELPRLLLLHHTNVATERVEIVDLEQQLSAEAGNLSVTASGPDQQSAGATFDARFSVANSGPAALDGIALALSATGAEIVSAVSSAGSCQSDGSSCLIGKLEPNASADVTVSARARSALEEASIEAHATAAVGCDSNAADDRATLTAANRAASLHNLEPRGGCGCRIRPNGAIDGLGLYALGASLIAAGRRRVRLRPLLRRFKNARFRSTQNEHPRSAVRAAPR